MTGDESGAPPLYVRIKDELRDAVARGEYSLGTPFITQREVCERFTVSTTTAVRALNELVFEGVLVRKRGKGTFVAERLPDEQEPPVRDGTAIACIVHGLHGPHVTSIVSGVESVCADRGYRMFLSDSGGDARREQRALSQAIDTGAAGVVLYPVEGDANADLLAELRRSSTPVVLVDRYRGDLATDAILADNFAVGYQVTDRLVELGHTRIATLWSETQCTSVRDRLTGHKQALHERGLPVRPDFTLLRPYCSQAPEARLAILQALLGDPQPPTVLLCANGYVVATVADDLIGLGVTVPDQMDLAGMDDAGPFDLLPLTALATELPSRQMGQRAMELLAERMAQDDPYREVRHVVLPAQVRGRADQRAHLRTAETRSA